MARGPALMSVFPVATPMSVSALCAALGAGLVADGQGERMIRSVAALGEGGPDSLVFCRFDGDRAQELISASRAGVIVVRTVPADILERAFIAVDDPRGWFIDALSVLMEPRSPGGVHERAVVEPGAELGDGVSIGPGAVIGAGARIGAGAHVGALSHISGCVVIEADVRIGKGCVIGCSGLSFHQRRDGGEVYFPHLGGVRIGRGAVIGAQTTLVRGILQDTVIGPGAQIGNQVNIGHNCSLGAACFISSGSVLTGGVQVGARARLAAGVRVNAHCVIGADARVGLGSVVSRSVGDGKKVFGNPARNLPTLGEF